MLSASGLDLAPGSRLPAWCLRALSAASRAPGSMFRGPGRPPYSGVGLLWPRGPSPILGRLRASCGRYGLLVLESSFLPSRTVVLFLGTLAGGLWLRGSVATRPQGYFLSVFALSSLHVPRVSA